MTTETYEKSIHLSFDTFFTKNLSSPIIGLFPKYKIEPGITKWADVEVLQSVHSILRSKYQNELRRHYFESRVKDLLFKYLVLGSNVVPGEKEPTEAELRAVYTAEEIISDNIAEHFPIPVLSKKSSTQ